MTPIQQEKLDFFRQQCRERHLSMTPQRLAIYEILAESGNHPCAEDIFERVRQSFPDIAIDTVYRTLTTFSEMGLIRVVEGYGESRRYDPDVGPHHHFRCRRCNRIVDFQEAEFDALKIPDKIGEKFNVLSVKVVLEGVCDRCQSNSNA